MIKVNFNTYNSYVTDSLYQWDVNRDLVINGLNLSVAPEIHFANANMDRAIVRQSTLESGVVTVRIPNSLLQAALTVKAYVGIYEGDTFKVIETVEIPVIAKARPNDYVFEDTDEEIYSFNKLENEIVNAKAIAPAVNKIANTTNALSAQVANIIAHNNDTEGNTELIDIRTGYDGTVYPSAGDAVRSQTKRLVEDLEDLNSARFEVHTGHNIIPINELKGGTVNGVTINVDKYKGIVTLKGTCTGTTSFELVPRNNKTYFSLLADNSYYAQSKTLSGNTVVLILGTISENIYQSVNKMSISPTENKDITRIALYLNGGTTYDTELYLYCATAADWDNNILEYTSYPKNLPANVYTTDNFPTAGKFALLQGFDDATIPIEVDTTAHTIKINKCRVRCGVDEIGSIETVTLNMPDKNGFVVYNVRTLTASVLPNAGDTLLNDTLLIMTYNNYGLRVSCPSEFTIDGSKYGTLEGAFDDHFNRFAVISVNSTYYSDALVFNTAAKTCTVNAGNIISGKMITGVLSASVNVTLTNRDGIIVYDTVTKSVYEKSRNISTTKTELILAVYNEYGKKVSTISHYSIDGFPYGIDSTLRKTQSPNYEYQKLTGASWWSDFVFINDELWVFCASDDETHTLKNGKIQVFDPITGAMKIEYKHDFGHCNTVHYNANTDKLLIANLPGNDTYPSALYIFDDVSSWRDKAVNSTIEFATEKPTIIDVSSLGNNARNTVACWGENNMSKHNIVYVSGNYNTDWWKILLGTGTNQLENGTYTASNPGEFNGTFNIIWHKTFDIAYAMNKEVIQGIDYDGIIRTSNGHDELQWWNWKPSDKGMTREENYVVPYNDDGSIKYCVSEGYTIKDGYAYIGCIFSNSSHTSSSGESGYIKVKLTD